MHVNSRILKNEMFADLSIIREIKEKYIFIASLHHELDHWINKKQKYIVKKNNKFEKK